MKTLNIGDTSDNGQITVIDEDRLCYLVKSTSRGAYGLRTISKSLLDEYIDYFGKHPDATANDARDALSGLSDIDKFEYGYSSTLRVMALMALGQIEKFTQQGTSIPHKNRMFDFPLQQIFYGAPGTGKSHEIKKLTKGESVIRTTFHPDSDYSTFVGCYKPTMDEVDTQVVPVVVKSGISLQEPGTYKEKHITYKFVMQAFLKAYLGAWKKWADAGDDRVAPQFLVIEEINRGNCAQIFGDLFQLLDRSDNNFSEYPIEADTDLQQEIERAFKEHKDYKINKAIDAEGAVKDYISNYDSTLSEDIQSGRILLLPPNLYIWATMNTSDQSLFPIDSAFKRRWDWRYIKIAEGRDEATRELLNWMVKFDYKEDDKPFTFECSWWDFIKAINEKIAEATSSDDKKLGYFFCKPKDKNSTTIDEERFVGKVVFYLWNDVFKDEENPIFKVNEGKGEPSFDAFYKEDELGKTVVDTAALRKFMHNVFGENKDQYTETEKSEE
ncbi:MAG: AAA family ATPase [Bacteroidales bacterium]|nr:AAA family ATPase [Bacteroidales bacterium]